MVGRFFEGGRLEAEGATSYERCIDDVKTNRIHFITSFAVTLHVALVNSCSDRAHCVTDGPPRNESQPVAATRRLGT